MLLKNQKSPPQNVVDSPRSLAKNIQNIKEEE